MVDALEPFLVGLELTPDHTLSDIRSEAKPYLALSELTNKFLKGQCSLEEFEDALAGYGIDPYEYWDEVEDNVDHIIKNDVAVEHAEFLLVDQNGYPLHSVH